MKHLLYALSSAAILLFLIIIWDAVWDTNIKDILLNVDFILPDSSRFEQIIYHLVTGVPLYAALVLINKYAAAFFVHAVTIAFIVTCSLYIILPKLALHTMSLSVTGFIGWIICHLLYFIIVYAVIKKL